MSAAEEAPVPLTVENAVKIAVHELPRYVGWGGLPKAELGIRVEEVFPPRGEQTAWRITLSHLVAGTEKPKHPALAAFDGTFRTPPPLERVYRVFEIDALTGEILRMRLRDDP
jgi:hypothetical protein